MEKAFFVYTHARPDGSIFYVGKGTRYRAHDFSPSRRTAHHVNIVRKYGRVAIVVALYPASSEDEAFSKEREMIADLTARGVELVNLTVGGEGASGRPPSERQKAALARGRGVGRKLSPDSSAKMLQSLVGGRIKAAEWRKTAEGQASIRRAAAISAAARMAFLGESRDCAHCGALYVARGGKSRFCSKACNQRALRAEQRVAKGHAGRVPGETGVPLPASPL